jgi:hypothetical protein
MRNDTGPSGPNEEIYAYDDVTTNSTEEKRAASLD